jgi:hypothetical protein
VDRLIAAHIDRAVVVDCDVPVSIMHAIGVCCRESVLCTFSTLPVTLSSLCLLSSRFVCLKLEILHFLLVHPVHQLQLCQQLLQRRIIIVDRAHAAISFCPASNPSIGSTIPIAAAARSRHSSICSECRFRNSSSVP